MKICDACGKTANKLYKARFTDDNKDTIGHMLNVCENCYPEEELPEADKVDNHLYQEVEIEECIEEEENEV